MIITTGSLFLSFDSCQKISKYSHARNSSCRFRNFVRLSPTERREELVDGSERIEGDWWTCIDRRLNILVFGIPWDSFVQNLPETSRMPKDEGKIDFVYVHLGFGPIRSDAGHVSNDEKSVLCSLFNFSFVLAWSMHEVSIPLLPSQQVVVLTTPQVDFRCIFPLATPHFHSQIDLNLLRWSNESIWSVRIWIDVTAAMFDV